MKEITLSIQITVEPDLTKLVKSTQRAYTDLVTGERFLKRVKLTSSLIEEIINYMQGMYYLLLIKK